MHIYFACNSVIFFIFISLIDSSSTIFVDFVYIFRGFLSNIIVEFGLIASRYFSAHCLKLTLKFTVETKEVVMDEVAKALDLNPNRFRLQMI